MRARVAISSALRKRIQKYGQDATEHLGEWLVAYDPEDETAGSPGDLQSNATPAIVAADAALRAERGVLWLSWLRQKRQPHGIN